MPVAPLTVKLVRVDGSPVARAVVTAQRLVGGVGPEGFVPSGTDTGVTDADGRYVFNLQTGDYTLRAVDPIGGYPIMNNLTVTLPEAGYSMEAATTQATVIDSILNTTTIVVPCFAPNGVPIAGAVITAQLSAVGQDGATYLSGEPITFLTDAAGFAELQLVPNVGGTTYTLSATDPETSETLIPATVVTVGSSDQMLQDLVAGNTNLIPSVDFTLDSTGIVPYGLSVTASASDPDGTIASYHWAINGVTAGTASALSASITTPGTHTVRLTVTDDDGAIRSTARTIVLSAISESAVQGIGLMPQAEAEAGTATTPRLISAEVLAAAIAALGGAGGLTPATQAEMEAGILASLRSMSPLLVSQAIAAQALQPADIGTTVQAHSAVLDATTASFTTADETKLDGVEAGATADQSAAEVPFTPTGDVAATNTQTAIAELDTEKLDAADIGTTVQAHSAVLDATTASFTTADETKLDGVEAGAAADQSAAEVPFTPTGDVAASNTQAAIAELDTEKLDAADIGTTVQAHSAVLDATTASFTTADETKLDGVEAGADVTDAANVLAALDGATIADAIPTSGDKFLVKDASAAGGVREVDYDDLPGAAGGLSNIVEDLTPQLGGNLDLNGNVITGLQIGIDVQAHSAVLDATTASFTTADETKLDGVEAGAAADQSAAEVPFTPTGDVAASDTQAAIAELDTEKLDAADIGTTVQAHSAVLDATTASFTTADETKLDGVEAGADVTDAANVLAALDGATIADAVPTSGDKFLVKDASAAGGVREVDYDDLPGGGGSSALPTVTNNTTRTLTGSDIGTRHHCNISSAITITMPALAGLTNGEEIEFYNDIASTANLTLDGNGTEPFLVGKYSNLTLVLAPGDSIAFRIDTVNTLWHTTYDGIEGPWCIAGHSGADQGFTTGSYVLLPFNEVTAGNDPYGIFDTSASNYNATPLMLGEYTLDFALTINVAGYVANIGPAVYKNGSLYKHLTHQEGVDDMVSLENVEVVVDSATDYFDVRYRGITGDEFTDNAYEPRFELRRKK